ncbi:MAG: hypothetical protein M0Q38_15460 [Bacteroidales bacterium]|jgi:hypothetical protein|nr:hypothetical protein [Bacteroidales bacterium]
MEKQPPFKFPESITDPQEILDSLTNDQESALSTYMAQGTREYYQSIMDELDRVENELRRARIQISRQGTAMRNLMSKIPLVKLRSGIDIKSGLN